MSWTVKKFAKKFTIFFQMVNMNFHAILIVGPSRLYNRAIDYKIGSSNQT